MVPSTIRKAIGTMKDQTSIRLAKVSSNLAPELEVAIVKATSHDDGPADERYVREIINFTSYSKGYVMACVAAVSRRLCKTRDWIVALKALMLIHRLIAEGVPAFQQELMHATRHGTRLLNMSDFCDEAHSSSWDHSAFVRTYALYLDQQLQCIVQGHKNEAAASSAWTASGGSINSHLDQMRWMSPARRHFSVSGVPDSSGSANHGWNANSSHPGCKEEEMRLVTPLRDMKPDKVLEWMHQLQQLFEHFLGCRPTGLAKESRLILVALYPIVRDSFQLYAAICEILAVLLDRFFDMDYADCVKSFEAYSIAAKQIDELAAFYAWCKDTGVARSSEYPEVQRVTDKLLETLEEFMRDRAMQPKSPPRRCDEIASAVQDQVLVQDMNSIKALPAPENFQEQKQQQKEKVVVQPWKAQNQPEVYLVDLRDDSVTADSQGNELAVALFSDGGTMKVANGTWEAFPSAVASGEREVTSAWQTPATETGKADWELALVETASNLSKQKASMGGGFDNLLLNGMYDQGLVMRHTIVQASGGSLSSGMLPGPGKTTPILALPSPDGTVHTTIGQDPFAASLSIPPPSYVQMADTDRKQQLLFLEQQMWQQYSRDGLLGQTSLAKLNNIPYYANPAMPYGVPPSAGYYYPHM